MENLGKTRPGTISCECLSASTGVVLSKPPSPISHLYPISSVSDFWNENMYYICPQTGVVWLSRYTEDMRNCPTVYERTACCQTIQYAYTKAKVTVRILEKKQFATPLHNKFGVPNDLEIPEFPRLPLEGLFFESFVPKVDVVWQCEAVKVRGKILLYLWLYLPTPLERGGSVTGELASPLELISQQVLQPSLTLEWWFAGGQIGEVHIEGQRKVPASEFFEWFGFDKPYRDTAAEFSAWLQGVRRHTRRR